MRTFRKKLHIKSTCAVLSLAVAEPRFAASQVTPLSTIRFTDPHSHLGNPDFTVTPANDLYTIVPDDSGTWQLLRTQQWETTRPATEQIALPGFYSRAGSKDLDSMSVHVNFDAAHNLVICSASATWLHRRGGRRDGSPHSDNVVAVIDAQTLRPLATTHTAALQLLPISSTQLLPDGTLLVLSTGEHANGAFVRLSLPDLQPSVACSYTWQALSTGQQHAVASTPAECAKLAPNGVDALLQPEHRVADGTRLSQGACLGSTAAFCQWPGTLSLDGRFGLAAATEERGPSLIVYAVHRHADLRTIPADELGHGANRSQIVSHGAQDYLLELSGDLRMHVFALRD